MRKTVHSRYISAISSVEEVDREEVLASRHILCEGVVDNVTLGI
jgi:hypothetical protein